MSFYGVTGKNPAKYMFHVQTLLPKAYVGTGTSGGNIDRFRNGGYAALSLVFLPGLWTDGTHTFVIEEAPDSAGSPGTYTTVVAADLMPSPEVGVYGTAATFLPFNAASTVVQRIDYIGRQRWVRVRSVESGVTTGAVYAVDAILCAPNIFPAA